MVTAKIDFLDLLKVADSGQAFRIRVIDDTHVELVAFGRYLQIADLGKDTFAFSCDEKEFEDIWKPYLDLDRDYGRIVKSIDKNDEYLMAAANFGKGIRILKQDIFETTISYIISQRRSIPSITTSVERISKLCGKKIKAPKLESPFVVPLEKEYYSFPTPEELNKLPYKELENTGVGYRAPYIARAAEEFSSGKLDPDALSSLSDDALYKALTAMYGVGTKVANCVMLFAFARTGRFPVDVWIQRIEDRYYNGHFDCTPYPDTAGIMQQFMFYYERRKPQL
ncbi:N-glycosylase/DNA lyase [Ruminococcaceae bacterium R-25]|nr:N-glycosylase/DNA lyase [Ruminococcaceae bacterium R-25]SUQ11663.1 N-glycosylase/DNA lyase [Oscillospiraceae bacterium]